MKLDLKKISSYFSHLMEIDYSVIPFRKKRTDQYQHGVMNFSTSQLLATG